MQRHLKLGSSQKNIGFFFSHHIQSIWAHRHRKTRPLPQGCSPVRVSTGHSCWPWPRCWLPSPWSAACPDGTRCCCPRCEHARQSKPASPEQLTKLTCLAWWGAPDLRCKTAGPGAAPAPVAWRHASFWWPVGHKGRASLINHHAHEHQPLTPRFIALFYYDTQMCICTRAHMSTEKTFLFLPLSAGRELSNGHRLFHLGGTGLLAVTSFVC